jgi:hypothetical protein
MSSRRFERVVRQRPAVLEDGIPVVQAPAGATVEWSSSRWGVEPTVQPLPRRGDAAWPFWPQFSPASLANVKALLSRVTTVGAPMGYLGPEERALEQRLADRIGPDQQGREPKVFAVSNGSVRW